MRPLHDAYLAKLAAVEDEVSNEFLSASELAILNLKGKQSAYQTANPGNVLRAQALKSSSDLRTKSEEVIAPVRNYLLMVIELPDDKIINASRNKTDG